MNLFKNIFLPIIILSLFVLLPSSAFAQSSCTINSEFVETTVNASGEEEHRFRLTVQFSEPVTGFYLSTPEQQEALLVERGAASASIITNSIVGNSPSQNSWDVFSLSGGGSPLCKLTYSPALINANTGDSTNTTTPSSTNPIVGTTQGGVSAPANAFDSLNPLTQFGDQEKTGDLSTPAGIVSRFLNFIAFPMAGLILFLMIVWGGFEILSQSATKKSIDAGRQRITAAIIGFVLLFSAYWIAQILEVVFGIQIL